MGRKSSEDKNARPKPSFTFKRPVAPRHEKDKTVQQSKATSTSRDDTGNVLQIPQTPDEDSVVRNDKTRRGSVGKEVTLPAPYWEEKLAKNVDLFTELRKSKVLRKTLVENPRFAEELMRHPDIAHEVARDEELAAKIIARPELIRELALARYQMLSELKHNVPIIVPRANNKRIRVRRKSIDPHQPTSVLRKSKVHNTELESSSSSSDEINASIVSIASRATLPAYSQATMATNVGVFPRSINYLKDCSRVYMRHHLELTDGLAVCCDKKREYYDILNKYGKILYRAYKSRNRVFCNKYKLVIREPDGTPLIVMSKKYSIRNRHTLAIYCPPTTYIGCVEQSWGLGTPDLTLRNEKGDAMMLIRVLKRPFLSHFKYHPEFAFEIKSIGDRNIIGNISPEWLDLPPGIFPGKDIYGAKFPKALSAKVKMTIIAAWFLIYSLYYNGKFAKKVRHNLSQNERDLVEYVFEESEDWRLKYDPSSDSSLNVRAS